MKNKILVGLAVVTVSLVSWKSIETSSKSETKKYQLDAASTKLSWTGKYVSDGHTHTGTVKVSDGNLEVAGNVVKGAFTVDMKTIICEDLQGEKNGYLVGHLNSADFFNTEKFTDVKVAVTGMTDKDLMATITVLGKELKTTIPVQVAKTANSMTAKGKFEIDFASLDLNAFKPSAGKPENQKTDSKIAFDLNLVMKN